MGDEVKPRALILSSVASMIEQFNMQNIQLLLEFGYDVDVACNCREGNTIPSERIQRLLYNLNNLGVTVYDIPFPRKIADIRGMLASYKQVRKICCNRQYSLMHCQSPIGSVIARLAARKARKSGTKVIYTAHGFHFYKGAPWLNWLVYFPVEWICSWFTDVLITINTEDYDFAKQHMHAKKIIYIFGIGIDLDKFKKIELSEEERKAKRHELGLQPGDKMLLSVGELNKNKNHEVVIRALAEMKDENIQYYIAGKGQLEEYLNDLVDKLEIGEQVHLLGYRSDVKELLQIADLFVFPSHREGLSVSLMEAIACQVSVVCSDIRGNKDLVIGDGLFNQKDVMDVANKITEFLTTDNSEKIRLNYENLQKYRLDNVGNVMKKVYENA